MSQTKDSTEGAGMAYVPREGARESMRVLVADVRARELARDASADMDRIEALPARRPRVVVPRRWGDIWASAGLVVMFAVAYGLMVWARSIS